MDPQPPSADESGGAEPSEEASQYGYYESQYPGQWVTGEDGQPVFVPYAYPESSESGSDSTTLPVQDTQSGESASGDSETPEWTYEQQQAYYAQYYASQQEQQQQQFDASAYYNYETTPGDDGVADVTQAVPLSDGTAPDGSVPPLSDAAQPATPPVAVPSQEVPSDPDSSSAGVPIPPESETESESDAQAKPEDSSKSGSQYDERTLRLMKLAGLSASPAQSGSSGRRRGRKRYGNWNPETSTVMKSVKRYGKWTSQAETERQKTAASASGGETGAGGAVPASATVPAMKTATTSGRGDSETVRPQKKATPALDALVGGKSASDLRAKNPALAGLMGGPTKGTTATTTTTATPSAVSTPPKSSATATKPSAGGRARGPKRYGNWSSDKSASSSASASSGRPRARGPKKYGNWSADKSSAVPPAPTSADPYPAASAPSSSSSPPSEINDSSSSRKRKKQRKKKKKKKRKAEPELDHIVPPVFDCPTPTSTLLVLERKKKKFRDVVEPPKVTDPELGKIVSMLEIGCLAGLEMEMRFYDGEDTEDEEEEEEEEEDPVKLVIEEKQSTSEAELQGPGPVAPSAADSSPQIGDSPLAIPPTLCPQPVPLTDSHPDPPLAIPPTLCPQPVPPTDSRPDPQSEPQADPVSTAQVSAQPPQADSVPAPQPDPQPVALPDVPQPPPAADDSDFDDLILQQAAWLESAQSAADADLAALSSSPSSETLDTDHLEETPSITTSETSETSPPAVPAEMSEEDRAYYEQQQAYYAYYGMAGAEESTESTDYSAYYAQQQQQQAAYYGTEAGDADAAAIAAAAYSGYYGTEGTLGAATATETEPGAASGAVVDPQLQAYYGAAGAESGVPSLGDESTQPQADATTVPSPALPPNPNRPPALAPVDPNAALVPDATETGIGVLPDATAAAPVGSAETAGYDEQAYYGAYAGYYGEEAYYPVDPETGIPIDPATGQALDEAAFYAYGADAYAGVVQAGVAPSPASSCPWTPRESFPRPSPEFFGVPLVGDAACVPLFLGDLYEYVLSVGKDEEYLFRLPGAVDEIQDLRQHLDSGAPLDLTTLSINVAADIIKVYFKKFPEPLFLHSNYDELLRLGTLMVGDAETAKAQFKDLLYTLPAVHLLVLRDLHAFLHHFSKFGEVTRMGTSNLSRVFTPNFMRPSEISVQYSVDLRFLTKLVVSLIDDVGYYFPEVYQAGSDQVLKTWRLLAPSRYPEGDAYPAAASGAAVGPDAATPGPLSTPATPESPPLSDYPDASKVSPPSSGVLGDADSDVPVSPTSRRRKGLKGLFRRLRRKKKRKGDKPLSPGTPTDIVSPPLQSVAPSVPEPAPEPVAPVPASEEVVVPLRIQKILAVKDFWAVKVNLKRVYLEEKAFLLSDLRECFDESTRSGAGEIPDSSTSMGEVLAELKEKKDQIDKLDEVEEAALDVLRRLKFVEEDVSAFLDTEDERSKRRLRMKRDRDFDDLARRLEAFQSELREAETLLKQEVFCVDRLKDELNVSRRDELEAKKIECVKKMDDLAIADEDR